MTSEVLRAVHMTPCNWLTSQRFEETFCFPSARYKLKTGQFGEESGPSGATDLEEGFVRSGERREEQ
jgi:hypothetical protein